AWLARMAEGTGATVAQRMAALAAAAEIDGTEALALLAAHVGDPEERVAKVAARGLLWRKRNDARAYTEAFVKTPHESVRKMAKATLGATHFDKHWKDYSKLPPAIQVNNTRTLAHKEINFAAQLKEKLESQDPHDLVQGLKILQTLADIKPFY